MAHYYRDLIVWNKAMDLATEVYQIARMLPKEELYALSSQVRRAVISIPSNIAEGAGRKSKREFVHFLKIANGSLNELETQLILCCRLGYVEETSIAAAMCLSAEIGKMINAMITTFEAESLN